MHGPAFLAGLVAAQVGGIFERHPAIAGLGQAPHHAAVELAGGELDLVPLLALGLLVGLSELIAVEVGEAGDLLGVEQRPLPVFFHPLHEQVGHPVGQVQIVGPPVVVAGVLLQLQEVLDVGVPSLQVHAGRALALAALVDCGHRAVQRLQPRNDAVGQAVGAPYERALGADAVPGYADAAGELGQPGDVGVALVDALQAVLGGVE